jgi:hypothetical protein
VRQLSTDSALPRHPPQIRALPMGYSSGEDPQLIAEAIVATFDQFCYDRAMYFQGGLS